MKRQLRTIQPSRYEGKVSREAVAKAVAESSAPESSPSIKQLTAWCREWQQTLRLQDWRVRIRFSKEYELDGKQAYCERDRALKSALITVNPYATAQHDSDAIAPYEERVIHELLHLHFDMLLDFRKGTLKHFLMEQSTDALAWALYRAKYGDKAKDVFVGTS